MYGLLSVLTSGLGDVSLAVSNIGARLISGTFNYTANRKLVFKSNVSKWKSVIQYVALAAGVCTEPFDFSEKRGKVIWSKDNEKRNHGGELYIAWC